MPYPEGLTIFPDADRKPMDNGRLMARVSMLYKSVPDITQVGFPVGWWTYYKNLESPKLSHKDGIAYEECIAKLGIPDRAIPFSRARAFDTFVALIADNTPNHCLRVSHMGKVVDSETNQDVSIVLSHAAVEGIHRIKNIFWSRSGHAARLVTIDEELSEHAFVVLLNAFFADGYQLEDFKH